MNFFKIRVGKYSNESEDVAMTTTEEEIKRIMTEIMNGEFGRDKLKEFMRYKDGVFHVIKVTTERGRIISEEVIQTVDLFETHLGAELKDELLAEDEAY